MTNPLVSVIIPNYNHARYLDERIQSVLNQTYQNFEVIILDDCSPDNGASSAVIERYRNNKHISHIVYNEQNSGSPFLQWNKGFELAKGELMWIAESDDSCDTLLLESLVNCLVANPQASVAFCRTIAFNENGYNTQVGYQGDSDVTYCGKQFIHDKMRQGTGILNASCAVFRKSKLYEIKGLFKTFKASGDRMFWIEMAETGDVIFSAQGLNKYRSHMNNSTKTFGLTGVNQKEDKIILDYLYNKKYITSKEYKSCSKIYVRVHIFEMITDKKLKQELYKTWNFSKFSQILLRLDAWKRKIFT